MERHIKDILVDATQGYAIVIVPEDKEEPSHRQRCHTLHDKIEKVR